MRITQTSTRARTGKRRSDAVVFERRVGRTGGVWEGPLGACAVRLINLWRCKRGELKGVLTRYQSKYPANLPVGMGRFSAAASTSC